MSEAVVSPYFSDPATRSNSGQHSMIRSSFNRLVNKGPAFIQNLRRGHYELAVDAEPALRQATAFDELRPAI